MDKGLSKGMTVNIPYHDLPHTSKVVRTRNIGLAGPSGAHPDRRGAKRAAARRVVAGDRACQNPHHPVRTAHGGGRRSVTRGDFASSLHDRWSPPPMQMWYNSGRAVGPEVVFDSGALSLTSR